MKKSDLARMLDVSHTQATKIVNGVNQPKIEYLVLLGRHFNVAIDDLILVDLSKGEGRKFGEGVADTGMNEDEQLRELNKLLRQRVAQVEQAIKESDPDLASELGIE